MFANQLDALYIQTNIEPASSSRVRVVCAGDTQVENTECRRGSAGVVPRRECIRSDGQRSLKAVEQTAHRQALSRELLTTESGSQTSTRNRGCGVAMSWSSAESCRAAGDQPVIPRTCARSRWMRAAHLSARGRAICVRRLRALPSRSRVSVGTNRAARRVASDQISSRCSTPCFSTFPFVISPGIQSGLSSGASSSHAHPS